MRQVLDLVALLEPVPFDTSYPPWDFTLIEGLEDGRAALYFRAHHVVTDGFGGIRLAGAFLDERGWPAGLQTPHVTSDRANERRKSKEQPTSERRRGTVTIDLTKATRPLGTSCPRGPRR